MSITGTLIALDLDHGDTLEFTASTSLIPSNGTVDINASTGEFTYHPDPDFSGNDSFAFTVSDASGEIDTRTVNVSVSAVNDVPITTNDRLLINADEITLIKPLLNDVDVDGDALAMVSFSNGEYGSAELLPQASKVALGGVLKAGDRYSLVLDVNGENITLTYLVSSFDVSSKKRRSICCKPIGREFVRKP